MASSLRNLSKYDETTIPNAAGLYFGIVVAEWNNDITHALYTGCYDTLIRHGAQPEHIYTMQVPGTFELPTGARILSAQQNVDAMICLGCVIKGETSHNEYINHAVANGLVNLGLTTGKAHIFGVLTPNDLQQAKDRAGGQHGNKGVEAAVTAIRMAALRTRKPEGKKQIGF
jgi:6,7-dimethyl-8-ribityllumazine synthase